MHRATIRRLAGVLVVALAIVGSPVAFAQAVPAERAAPRPDAAAAAAPAGAPTATQPAPPPAASGSVHPGINDPYRDPKLDVAQWAANFAGDNREAYAAREAVVRAMALRPGQRVADIGAGTGIYVPLFARAVGPRGRVYAVDIAPRFLEWIEKKAAADGLRQVTTVLGADRTTNLPEGSVDVVFHSDAYHHFEDPDAMNGDLARALVPGGAMYVLDFQRIEGVSNEWTLRHVRAGKETVIREIEAAGFEFVREIALPELRTNYLLQFRKR
jgi:predicted methyltransferase